MGYVTQENLSTYNTQIKNYIGEQDKKVVSAAKGYINTELAKITLDSLGAESAGAAATAEQNAKNYADTQISALVDSAPETMDTLKELADAIKTNGDAVTAINSAISSKVDKEEGKGLSANDFTDEYKAKLESLNNSGSGKNYIADNSSIRWELHTCYGNKVNADDPTDVIKVKFDTPVITIAKESTSTTTGIKRFTASCEGFEDAILDEVIDTLADWEADKQGTLVASGTDGNIEWSLYDCGRSTTYNGVTTQDYTFYLEGTGNMKTYGSKNQPWYTYRKGIREVRVGRDITLIEPSAFYPCNLFLRYKVHPCNTIYDSRDSIGLLTLTATDCLNKYPSGRKDTEMTIPSLYKSIGANVFSSNGILETVVIPCGIKEIQNNAFSSSRISNVTIAPGVRTIGGHAFESCSSLKSLTIPGSVTTISEYSFSNCYNLETLIIKGAEVIDKYAFSYCSVINSITLPNTLKRIEDSAFTDCSELTSIVIPDSVEYIGENAFSKCPLLTSITIGKGVKEICPSAFAGCSNLNVIINEGNSKYCEIGTTNAIIEIDSGDLVTMPSTSTVSVPSGVLAIGEKCFLHDDVITEVTLPEGLTRIRDKAFAGCRNLKTINLPTTFNGIEGTPFTGPCYTSSYSSNLVNDYVIPFTKVTYRGNIYEGTRDEINAALLAAWGFQLI